jgi:hypothetical protein
VPYLSLLPAARVVESLVERWSTVRTTQEESGIGTITLSLYYLIFNNNFLILSKKRLGNSNFFRIVNNGVRKVYLSASTLTSYLFI